MRSRESDIRLIKRARQALPAIVMAGLLCVTSRNDQPENSIKASTTTETADDFSAMPNPCVTERSPQLDRVAEELTQFWQKQNMETEVTVVYIPEKPESGCQVELSGDVSTISGSQDIVGNSGVAISPTSSSTAAAELRLILRHEVGHQIQEEYGSETIGSLKEAIADCYAGMSSVYESAGEITEYRLALQNAGSSFENDPHGTALQREAYFMHGYTNGSCDPAELIAY